MTTNQIWPLKHMCGGVGASTNGKQTILLEILKRNQRQENIVNCLILCRLKCPTHR